mgnify:CR=1 FL=1
MFLDLFCFLYNLDRTFPVWTAWALLVAMLSATPPPSACTVGLAHGPQGGPAMVADGGPR